MPGAITNQRRANMQQADDFLAESESLYAVLKPLKSEDLERVTAFKDWTINEVVAHLSLWNRAAILSLSDPDALKALFKEAGRSIRAHGSGRQFERESHDGAWGEALVEAWRVSCDAVHAGFSAADPSQRVPWVGPDMSARSSVSARLMETWAHGQEIFDELGQVRSNTDRIHNIVVLGINTYGWTFKNRGEQPPEPKPYVQLTAPSGAQWQFHEESADNLVRGSAEAFCQVVTQVRNVADTDLEVVGAQAQEWMAKAQCFAGPPNEPPAPGTRLTRR